MGLEENNIQGVIPLPELDRCVACGLCLPVCPTYEHTKRESASPRGRLALIRGLLKHDLPDTVDMDRHLSLCLQCRACERACPADVEFGWLMDTAKGRRQNTSGRHLSLAEKLIYWLTRCSVDQGQKLMDLVKTLQNTGLIRLAKSTGMARISGLHYAIGLLPRLSHPLKTTDCYQPDTHNVGTVYLFTGCLGRLLDPETLRATISVLTKLGYEVRVPPTQACCGALHLHDGDFDIAQTLAQQNVDAFGDSDTPIISVVSGCGSALSEYGRLVEKKKKTFGSRMIDINSFLTSITWPSGVKLKPLAARVLVQDPCSLRNVLRAETSVYELLNRIPAIEIEELEGNATCCGGAGIYPVREPEMASILRNKKIEALTNKDADFLVSANLGCAIHIKSGMESSVGQPEVLHPVSLIDRQLET